MTTSDARGPNPVKRANPADYSAYFSAPAPQMVRVISTNIRAFGWTEVEPRVGALVVTFASGATYRYAAVPQQVFQLLLVSESKGGAFHDLVKRGPYPCVRTDTSNERRIQAVALALSGRQRTFKEIKTALTALVDECLADVKQDVYDRDPDEPEIYGRTEP